MWVASLLAFLSRKKKKSSRDKSVVYFPFATIGVFVLDCCRLNKSEFRQISRNGKQRSRKFLQGKMKDESEGSGLSNLFETTTTHAICGFLVPLPAENEAVPSLPPGANQRALARMAKRVDPLGLMSMEKSMLFGTLHSSYFSLSVDVL
jgi:hypothetical protein